MTSTTTTLTGTPSSVSEKDQILNESSAVLASKNGLTLQFWGVNFSVPEKAASRFQFLRRQEEGTLTRRLLLDNVHGVCNAGELVAVMGASGSGKTTLCRLLAGRVKTNSKSFQGTILANGRPLTKRTRKEVAFVQQDDLFLEEISVRDTLQFTALMRLPRHMERAEKLAKVEEVANLFEISHVMEQSIRQLSGGQRKRVSIVSELLTNPSAILLDEPCSGLDSVLAYDLVKTLRRFAHTQNKAIILVIHQPSSQIVKLFDRLMVLSHGNVVYNADPTRIIGYVGRSIGQRPPDNTNLADWMLELTHDTRIEAQLIDAYKKSVVGDDITGQKFVLDQTQLKEFPEPVETDPGVYYNWEATYFQQLSILTKRAAQHKRTILLTPLYMGQNILLAIVAGLLWQKIDHTERHTSDYGSNIFFSVTYWGFEAIIEAVANFEQDRAVLKKERASRSYRLSAYFLSKCIADFMVIGAVFGYSLIIYFMTQRTIGADNFFVFFFVLLLTTLCSQSFGYVIGSAITSSIEIALSFASVTMLVVMLLGGFYIKNMPSWLLWSRYISFVRYGYHIILLNFTSTSATSFICDLDPPQFSACTNGTTIPGHDLVTQLGFYEPWWVDLILLTGQIVILRLIAYTFLRHKI